jgi:hypothetical protein
MTGLVSTPSAQALTTTPLGLRLLARLAGLDLWEFLDQIGVPTLGGTSLMAADPPDPGRGPAQPGHPRLAADVVADRVALVAADLGQLAACRDRLALLAAFAAVMCGDPAAAAAPYLASAATTLLPVARALAAAPAARWWWQPPDRGHQRWLGWDGRQIPRGTTLAASLRAQAAADEQEEGRASREFPWPPGEGNEYTGTWWSPPLDSGTAFTTTGPVGPLPATELGCMMDNVGEDRFEVWDVQISPQARIWNITSPGDWGRLTARYPRDVTASRRHGVTTGTG